MAFTHILRGVDPHRHDTVTEAYECEAQTADMLAELAAEAAVERYFETRDWAEQAAFDDYERRMGKVPFEDAYAAAMADA
jgi:hypothetical protein